MEDESYNAELESDKSDPDFEFSEEEQAEMVLARIAEVQSDLANPQSSTDCLAVRNEEIDILTNGRTRRRPELNGTRRKHPNDEQVFLIDEGRRRKVDNWGTYDHLFRSRGGIINDRNVFEITPGLGLSEVHRFCFKDPFVYVRDFARRPHLREIRLVVSPEVMDKFHFNWTSVRTEADGCTDGVRHSDRDCPHLGGRDFR